MRTLPVKHIVGTLWKYVCETKKNPQVATVVNKKKSYLMHGMLTHTILLKYKNTIFPPSALLFHLWFYLSQHHITTLVLLPALLL